MSSRKSSIPENIQEQESGVAQPQFPVWRRPVALLMLVSVFCTWLLESSTPLESRAQNPGGVKFLDGVEDDSVDIVPGLTTFLEPAAPSPFTSSTEIAYTLAEESPVTLKVFDFFYVHVATLVEKDSQPPGRYVVPFAPGGSIASGMYFYTLETHEDRLIRRFLYLR